MAKPLRFCSVGHYRVVSVSKTDALTARARWAFLLLSIGLSACGGQADVPMKFPAPTREPVEFAFRATDGALFASYDTRGRANAVLFVTTYDWASQVLARRLAWVVSWHRPRANAGAIVLESEEYRTLADVFRSSLGLPFPVAMADEMTRSGRGPFGSIPRIPTVVVLDREGRERWRAEGMVEVHALEQALTEASRSPTIDSDAPLPGQSS